MDPCRGVCLALKESSWNGSDMVVSKEVILMRDGCSSGVLCGSGFKINAISILLGDIFAY
jgi:hypothetical protein